MARRLRIFRLLGRRTALREADRLLNIALAAGQKYRALGVPYRTECERLDHSLDEIKACISSIRRTI